jgi:hypothetical protein
VWFVAFAPFSAYVVVRNLTLTHPDRMTFLNPFALIGLIAAGIPILLHLLNLRKVRVIEFSTLSFLKELQPTTLRRLRIRQLLLLILRTLLIILLVLAFSRPTLKGTGASSLGARVKTTAVLAIDDSPSMERHDRKGSLWSQAIAAASGILNSLQDGDEIILLPFSAASSVASHPQLPSWHSIARTRSELNELRTGTVSGSLDRIFRMADGMFAKSVNAQQELYLISDFQEGLFSGRSDMPEVTARSGTRGFHTYAIRVGESSTPNLGISDARVVNSIIEQGKPFTVSVTLTNSSDQDVDNSVVSVFLNGTRVTAKAVDVKGGTSPTFEIPVVAGTAGFINGSVALDDDEFPFDNRRFFSINLRRELRVILLGPSPSLRYIRAAIGTRSASGPTVRMEESTIDRLSGSLLQKTDVLIIANASSMAASQIAAVKAFLESGGGMLYFPGPSTDARSYQALASAVGLPDFRGLRSTTPASNGTDASATLFEEVDQRHPIFQQMFQPRIGGDVRQSSPPRVESPHIWSHVMFGPSPCATVVATLTDGSPFLIDRPVGSGRVLLFAIEAEPSWSDFPFKGLFVPLLLRSVSYVAQEQAIMPGTIAGSSLPALAYLRGHGPLTIHTPLGNTIAVPTIASEAESLAGEALTEVGVYDVTEGSSTITRFVVNGAPGESLLRPAESEEVEQVAARSGVETGQLTWIDDSGSLGRVISEARFGVELWRLALLAALVVALLELLLARSTRRFAEHSQKTESGQPSSTPPA